MAQQQPIKVDGEAVQACIIASTGSNAVQEGALIWSHLTDSSQVTT